MTGVLNKLYVEHGMHGATIMARSLRLSSGCLSDAEIDASVDALKADLDACAREMKRLVKINSSGPMFEGWLSPADELSEQGG